MTPTTTEIPYTTAPRLDTGVSSQTMGMWLFLASEVMLFGALFSAYTLLRVSAPTWPHGRDVLNTVTGAINTGLLLLASGLAWRARSTSVARGRQFLVVSSAVSVLFLLVKALEYRGELQQGLLPATNTFLAMYFTLTGLHALHVIGGLVANIWALTGWRRVGDAMTAGRVRSLGLYWAFVDVVWLVIFILVYLS